MSLGNLFFCGGECDLEFNIPYVIKKNPHTLSYIRGLTEATSILSKVSFTTRLIYTDLITKLPKGKSNLKPYELAQYTNMIMGIAVDSYLNNPSRSTVVFDGIGSFDISKARASDTDGDGGRYEFVDAMPELLAKKMSENPLLADNALLKHISGVRDPEINPITGESISYLRGINTAVTEEDPIAEFKMLLQVIREVDSDLHSALFLYNLIINKGGLGSDSIASLFELSDYAAFEKHLVALETTNSIVEQVTDMNLDVKGLLVPSLLMEFSTQAGFENMQFITTQQADGADMDMQQESEGDQFNEGPPPDEQPDYDEQGVSRVDFTQIASDKFDLTDINMLRGSGAMIPDVWKSKTNGLIYAWNEDISSYVPVTKTTPDKTINFKITPRTTINDLKDLGYDWGWKIQFIDGSYGRVLTRTNSIIKTYNVRPYLNEILIFASCISVCFNAILSCLIAVITISLSFCKEESVNSKAPP